MIYFTADTHFNHKNIIKYCGRPFGDVTEMNKVLIDNWNARVCSADTVYFLGDFCFGKPAEFLAELNGDIIFIKGSHDPNINAPYLMPIKIPIIIEDGYQKLIVLCHYAMRSWERSHYRAWHLYGHHHGRLAPYGLSFDVGVDCWDYYPVSLLDVVEKMKGLNCIVDYTKASVT